MAKKDKNVPKLEPLRQTGQKNAIVFIHGFTGHYVNTWQKFPQFIQEDPDLAGWDVYCLGYETQMLPFITGVWESNPSLPRLAIQFETQMRVAPMGKYEALTLVGHSMGGLVLQRALANSPELCRRVSHAFCYGTPSQGLAKANLGSLFNPQARGMRSGGPFIKQLRRDWEQKFQPDPGFRFCAVAGDVDEFVPSTSSLGAFSHDQCRVVTGNHLEIVKPDSTTSDRYRVLRDGLLGETEELSFLDAARVASERNEFREVVRRLEPHTAELDDQHMADLAIALSEIGQEDKATALLEQHAAGGETDFLGVWGGRLKRRWRLYGHRADINKAVELYQSGYDKSVENEDPDQIYYHAINLAHLYLIGKHSRARAWHYAQEALNACEKAPERNYWVIVTEAEACIYLNRFDEARERFAEALRTQPQQRWIKSTYQQAWYSLKSKAAREKILSVFGDARELALAT